MIDPNNHVTRHVPMTMFNVCSHLSKEQSVTTEVSILIIYAEKFFRIKSLTLLY